MLMDPITGNALLGAGVQLLGGLFGKRSDDKQRQLYSAQLRQAQGQFDSQMDESIQRRVKDAIAAGVHPLFALGGSAGASPTVAAGQPPQSSNSMQRAATNISQIMAGMPSEKARVARDEAEAAYLNSEAAKNRLDIYTRGRDSLGNPDGAGVKIHPMPDTEPMGEATYYSPEIPKSKATGIRAGTSPGTIDAVMPDGRHLNLYDPDLGLDEISQIDAAYQRAIHKASDLMYATDRAIRSWFKTQAKRVKQTRESYRRNQAKRPRRY
ncbi:DNA pilot protein [Microviridae sp.]|nr:DNA pilot protein [Microviridae sp.]